MKNRIVWLNEKSIPQEEETANAPDGALPWLSKSHNGSVLVIPWSLLKDMSPAEYLELLRSYRDSYESVQTRNAAQAEERKQFERLLSDVELGED